MNEALYDGAGRAHTQRLYINIIFSGLLMGGLYLTSLYSYLLFHTVTELFGIAISVSIFILVWNSRRYMDNSYLLLLGISLLFVACIDIIHTMAFKGMSIFTGYDANLPTQLWIIARYLQSVTLLIAAFVHKRKVNIPAVLSVYGVLTVASAASCFIGIFPACYVELKGLTAFKINSEYLIIAILSVASLILWQTRKRFDSRLVILMIAGNLFSIGAEFSFTKYFNVYGLSNLAGHLLKTSATILWYFAIVQAGVTRPAEILYKKLSDSEEKYRGLFASIDQGLALHEIIVDAGGKPVDYVFLDINDSYTKLFGITREMAVGRRIKEIMPDVEQYWIDIFGKVALTGISSCYDNVLKRTGRHYSTYSYCPKKNQFAVLVTDITDRKLAEEKINSLLAEKELLLREVHHRIKNNMNTVKSLLTLQAMAVKEPSAAVALQDAGNRVQSMSLLYDKLYRSADFTEVSANEYLSPLVDEILGNFPDADAVTVKKNIEAFPLDAWRLQPLGIIINELLTNIMKYAFTGRKYGMITVSAAVVQGRICVSVQDDGNGIPESVSFENSTGFGLSLVKALTEQLTGTIRIERGNGTKIVVEFEK